MLNSDRAYAFGAGGVMVSQGVSALAGVLSLWLLARILTTDQLAGYVVAMSVLTLVGYNAGLAIERAMVLRVAELPVKQGTLAGRGMLLRLLLIMVGLAMVALTCVVFIAQSDRYESAWLVQMSPIIPAITMGLALTAWFQANHQVGTSALMQGLTDGGRCLFFGTVFLAGLGPSAVAYSAVLAAALPILTLSLLARGKSKVEPSRLYLKDLGAGLQFLVMRISHMGVRQLDIIIVGIFSTGLEIAQYAVAARISAFAAVGQQALSNTYMPRVRRHLATSDQDAIKREFYGARLLSFLMTLLAAILLFSFGAYLLGVFGNFSGGYSALLILMAAQLLYAGYGMQAVHLAMSGDLHVAAFVRVLTLVAFVVSLFLLVPTYATVGAGLSAVVAACVFSACGAQAMRWRSGPDVPSPILTVVTLTTATAMIVGALFPEAWVFALLVLVSCFIALLFSERDLLVRILRGLLQSRHGD